jgi:hypothetical protein
MISGPGYRPNSVPRDDRWGERYFHLTGPGGHQLGFAWSLPRHQAKDTMVSRLASAMFWASSSCAP